MEKYYNPASRKSIIKPRSVIITTRYFWRKWRPILGNDLAVLVIEARQKCYRNDNTGEVRDWFYSTLGDLGQVLGFSAKKVSRLLKSPHAQEFIRFKPTYFYNPELEKRVKGKCLFKVSLDDPLIPEDEINLANQAVHNDVSFEVRPNPKESMRVASLEKRPNGQHVCNNYSTFQEIYKYKSSIYQTRREKVEPIFEALLDSLKQESPFAQGILRECSMSQISHDEASVKIMIEAPNPVCKTWIEQNYSTSIREFFKVNFDSPFSVEIRSRENKSS